MVSPLVGVTGLAGAGSLVIAGLVWRRRDAPGAGALAVTMVAFALYAGLYAIALTVFDAQVRYALLVPIAAVAFATPAGYAVFALEYTGWGDQLSTWSVAFFAHPALLTVAALTTNHLHGLAISDFRVVHLAGAATTAFDAGPVLIWAYLFSYLLTGIGTIAILRTGFSGEGTLYRGQALGIAAWSTIIGTANLAYFLQIGPLPYFDASPIAAGFVGVVLWYPIYDDVLFEQIPAALRLGRDAVIEHISEAVFVVDREGRVIDLNPAGTALLDVSAPDIVGKPLSELLGLDRDRLAAPDSPIELDTPAGRRTFDPVVSPVADEAGRPLGQTVVLHDVTERERRQERLRVFNRVLRHNLRNELEVAHGHVERLAAGDSPPDAGRHADRASTALQNLAELGEKAREIDRIADRSGEAARADVCALVDAVVTDFARRYPDASITADCRNSMTATIDGYVFESVLGALVENGVEHNDREHPTVTVDVSIEDEVTGASIAISVVDDGPGMPAHEREAVLAGEETPLKHGSGLGLWLVKWGVSELGGTLDIESVEPRGTVVTVRIPSGADDPSLSPPTGT